MAHVLIATLGDSPIVVTSMFYLLTEQEKLSIDEVIVLHPQGDNRDLGYIVINEALQGLCAVQDLSLPYEDTDDEQACFDFLKQLFVLIYDHQQQGNTVSLSLAGGRKNMSAIMALIAPFFYRCIKGLYHVIDKSDDTDKRNFKSIEDLEEIFMYDRDQLLQAMHPDLADLRLVPIPFKNALRVSEAYIQKLLAMTAEQLQDLWESDPDEASKEQFYLEFVNSAIIEPLLQVYLTQQAYEEFNLSGDTLARDFVLCFKNMRFPRLLDRKKHGPLPDKRKSKPYPCYVYKRGRTTERPFFHTEPGDIANYPQNKVERVIVERLAKHRNETEYTPSTEQLIQTKYKKEELCKLEDILKNIQAKESIAEDLIPSILIVPMGTQPMVATQLYTLLRARERRDIQEVILLHPEGAGKVKQAARTVKEAFANESDTCTVTLKPISGLADIASKADCERYQAELEQLITGLQATTLQQHPDWLIDLALSGGRKGMAAMALFAAQRTQLREVYHTLIANPKLDRQIEFATSPQEFGRLQPDEKNDTLFLRAYAAHEADFRLFKVPMGPLRGKGME